MNAKCSKQQALLLERTLTGASQRGRRGSQTLAAPEGANLMGVGRGAPALLRKTAEMTYAGGCSTLGCK